MKPKLWISHVLGALVFFTVIYISAGTLHFWQGHVYVGLGLLMMLLNYTVLRVDKALLEERSKPGLNTKPWDKRILGLSFLATIAMFIVAGLDAGRFHWSPKFPWYIALIGIVLTATGQLLFMIAQKQNKFFSSTVRIQTDRSHTVCNEGLYKVVRHPGYLGSLLQAIGFPLLFGAVWSSIPVGVSILLQLIRTKMEDDTLQNELSGYSDYAQQVKYRLIPFIW